MVALPRWGAWALGATAAVLLAARVAAVYTEAFNWDELALMYRVERSIATATLVGGGRPGLAVLALWPLVQGCASEVATLHTARLFWVGLTTLYLAGVYALVREALAAAGVTRRQHAAALAVALLLSSPIFYRWSIQVRTDQLALACASWGAALLLGSRRRAWMAALAGLLFGLGYLASQKAAYVGGLAGLVASVDVLANRPVAWRKALLRVALLSLAALTAVEAFYATFAVDIPLEGSKAAAAVNATTHGLDTGLEIFAFYRRLFGYSTYLAILRRSPLQSVLLVGFVATLAVSLLRRRWPGRALTFALVTLVAGLGVALFHASAFAYFWMTLGLFVAVTVALAFDSMLELLPSERLRRALTAGTWIGLAATCAPAMLETLTDTQRVQREGYEFVAATFQPGDRGFQPEGGLFCRHDPDPFEVYMLETVRLEFIVGRSADNVRRLEAKFREGPVKFILGSQPMLALPFPRELKTFWASHYVAYYRSVMVPGQVLRGDRGTLHQLDLIAAGRYRWVLEPGLPPARFRLDGREVSGTDQVELEAGAHEVELLQPTRFALLVLDVGRPPEPDNGLTFYSRAQSSEIAWARDSDW